MILYRIGQDRIDNAMRLARMNHPKGDLRWTIQIRSDNAGIDKVGSVRLMQRICTALYPSFWYWAIMRAWDLPRYVGTLGRHDNRHSLRDFVRTLFTAKSTWNLRRFPLKQRMKQKRSTAAN